MKAHEGKTELLINAKIEDHLETIKVKPRPINSITKSAGKYRRNENLVSPTTINKSFD